MLLFHLLSEFYCQAVGKRRRVQQKYTWGYEAFEIENASDKDIPSYQGSVKLMIYFSS